MHEISFEQIEDGLIRLEQQLGFDEANVVLLHPEQLKFITRRMCGINAATANKLEDLERRLSILADELEFIVLEDDFRRQIVDCMDGIELMTRLDALLDLAYEFDGGRLAPRRCNQDAQQPSSGASTCEPKPKPHKAKKNATKDECDASGSIQTELPV